MLISQNILDFSKEIEAILVRDKVRFCSEKPESVSDNQIFPVIVCINISDLPKVIAKILETNNYQVYKINNDLFEGIFIKNKNNLPGIIFATKAKYISQDIDKLNHSRDSHVISALREYGKKHNLDELINIDFNSAIKICQIEIDLMAASFNMDRFGISCRKYLNSTLLYMNKYFEFTGGRKYQIQSDDSPTYDHIEHFSRIYYWTIKLLSSELKNIPKITIHDVGTNVAHFPLILSILKQEHLQNLDIEKIIASDLQWTGVLFVEACQRLVPGHRPIDFPQIDIINEPEKIPYSEGTVINDVFEHLPDEEAVFTALKNIWEKTKNILIIHVPFEEHPKVLWEHKISFNPQKLKLLAKKLPDAENLSEEYFEDDGKSILEHGFLILRKTH
jgi:hypothetical protein